MCKVALYVCREVRYFFVAKLRLLAHGKADNCIQFSAQATRFVFSAGEVNVQSGARPQPGPVVRRYGGTLVTKASDGDGITYIVSDQTGFGLRVTSSAFRGPKSDRWFFNKANFAGHADEGVNCLAGFSN